jgi:hypothetical protein
MEYGFDFPEEKKSLRQGKEAKGSRFEFFGIRISDTDFME